MPSFLIFHDQTAGRRFWRLVAGAPPPTSGPGQGGYPAWQASVITPVLFGALGAWCEAQWARIRWMAALWRRVHGWPAARRAVFVEVVDLLSDPAYPEAIRAVGNCAQTLAFSRPESWLAYWRPIKANPRTAENLFRHIHASALFGQALTGPIPPTVDLLIELAYREYTKHPDRHLAHD